jgi:hypothetical protein
VSHANGVAGTDAPGEADYPVPRASGYLPSPFPFRYVSNRLRFGSSLKSVNEGRNRMSRKASKHRLEPPRSKWWPDDPLTRLSANPTLCHQDAVAFPSNRSPPRCHHRITPANTRSRRAGCGSTRSSTLSPYLSPRFGCAPSPAATCVLDGHQRANDVPRQARTPPTLAELMLHRTAEMCLWIEAGTRKPRSSIDRHCLHEAPFLRRLALPRGAGHMQSTHPHPF